MGAPLMWDDIVVRLNRLKSIDRQLAALGAQQHRYLLNPLISRDGLRPIEHRLGVQLPETLRAFYSEVGNGGAGPHYGLQRAEGLHGFRPHDPYPGIESIRQQAAAEGSPPNERGYFEVPHEALAGLLAVIHEGCGHHVCLITAGSNVGNVVFVSADGFVSETRDTLIDVYSRWLNSEIEQFEAIGALMVDGLSLDEISDEMQRRYSVYDTADRIASILDVEKPVALFGERPYSVHHWAVQKPWFEMVLKQWQAEFGSAGDAPAPL